MKIVIVGCGYVGLANGVMLAEHHRVDMVDINKKKVTKNFFDLPEP